MKFDDEDLMVKKALNTIQTPESNIKEAVQKKIQRPERFMNFKKVIPVTFVAFMMLIFSVGVSAAYVPTVNHLLSFISPEIALKLQPIEQSSEDGGIKMEVVAAMSDKEMAIIYVTMQDLKGDRIDETLDLYDSFSLTGARMFNSQLVHYDETTKTATLRIQANGGKNLNGKKLNFRVNAFLSDKKTFEEVEIDVNLADIKNSTPQTIELDMENSSGGGGDLFREVYNQGKLTILKPDETKIILPEIDSLHISNIGFIDNRLHVQTKWSDDNIDDHGFFYFVDPSGNKIHPSGLSVYFGIDDSGATKYGNKMVEYISDMNDLELNTLKLVGDFVTNGNYTTGNWSTTFKIQSVEEKTTEFTKDYGTWTTTRVTASPLGITLYGTGKDSESDDLDVSAKMKDGSVQLFDSMTSYSEKGKVTLKFIPDLPLDILQVQSITIDGTEIGFS